MILKKPYAFLIKYFKWIHIFLTLFLFYLSFKISNILFFFNNFIKTNKIDFTINLAKDYIGILPFLLLLIILGINIFILLLMKYKKKPVGFYIVNIVGVIIFFIVLLYTNKGLYLIGINEIDVKNIRINKDIIFISSILSYLLVLFNLYRASGFNLKKFNFEKDINAIALEEKDNEEVEVQLNIDTEKLTRSVNKNKRILLYFYKENKFIIDFITISVTFIILIMFLLNFLVINKKYQEKEKFTVNGIRYQILESFKTDCSYNNENIGKNKYYYTIVKVQLENLTNDNILINRNIYRLKVNNKYIDMNTSLSNYFLDIGKSFDTTTLFKKTKKEFIFVFQYNKQFRDQKKEFQVLKNGLYKKNELFLNFNKVKLNELEFKKQNIKSEMNKRINLNNDIYYNTIFRVNNYQFKDQIFYKYNFCINDNCMMLDDFIKPTLNNYITTILKLDIDIIYDKRVNKLLKKDIFLKDYASFKYVKNNKTYVYDNLFKNVTPNNNEFVYFEVSKQLENTDKLYLILNIRGEKYTIKLK